MVSASAAGDSIAWIEFASSAGACGSSVMASTAFCFSSSVRASTSGWRDPGVVEVLDARHEVREAAHGVEHAEAPLALAHQVVRAVGRGDVADDRGRRADPVQVVERRVGGLGVLLQQEADLAFGAHGFLGAGHGLVALDRDREDHARGTARGCGPAG